MCIAVRLKHWFFTHYWWILSLTTVAMALLLAYLKEPPASFAGVAGAFLSVIYFVQKQKLEEMRLFREIFKECNVRYDAMNELLARVCAPNEAELSQEERDLLIDYFNLCGEEYLYYRQGYIPPVVWESWHMGMQIVLCSPRVNTLWRSEEATGSYYELPIQR